MFRIKGKEVIFLVVVIALCSFFFLVTGAIGADKPIKLRIAHVSPKNSPSHFFALSIKTYLEGNVPGKFDVKIFPVGQLGNIRQNIEQVQAGNLEIALANTGNLARFFPEIDVLDLPYLFPNFRAVWDVFNTDNPVIQGLNDILVKKTGMRIFGVASAGDYRSFANSKRRVRTPDDMKGLKFRTIPSKVQTEFVKTMGAMPTPVAWTELYVSIQTGVVDGTKNSIAEMVDMKFHEVLKYATIDNHSTVEMMWVINEKYRKSLPDDLRNALNSAAYFASVASHGINYTFSQRNQKIWVDSGGEIYFPNAEEKALFVKKAQPVYKWFREKYENGDYWIDTLQNAIKESTDRRNY